MMTMSDKTVVGTKNVGQKFDKVFINSSEVTKPTFCLFTVYSLPLF